MSDELPTIPPIEPPTNDNSTMDEFEVKQPAQPNTPGSKKPSSKIKTTLVLGGALVFLVAAVLIVMLALQNTGSNTPLATPTPLPTVVQFTPVPAEQKDLPIEWLNVENSINVYQNSLTKPNDDRAKLSIPSINFETTLQE